MADQTSRATTPTTTPTPTAPTATGEQPVRNPAAAVLAHTDLAEVRHDLWWAIWHRAADVAGVDPYTDPATLTGDPARAAALVELSIAETAAAYVAEMATDAARRAAAAGASYTDLGHAAGVSRQAARKRWPGLTRRADSADRPSTANPDTDT